MMDAMDESVYKDDVQHVIVDNLQFMMPDSYYSTSTSTGKDDKFDKFAYMDSVVHRLRRFATEKDVSYRVLCCCCYIV